MGAGKKWRDSGCVLEAEWPILGDVLDVGAEWWGGIKCLVEQLWRCYLTLSVMICLGRWESRL